MALTPISPQIQDWLATLVRERVHPAIDLRFVHDVGWELRAPGSDRCIAVTADTTAYQHLTAALPPHAASWDPRSEGWTAPLGVDLLAPGCAALPRPLVADVSGRLCIHFDLLRFALWSLSRAEELVATERDGHDRFPAHASHAHRLGYLDRPLVDEWFAVLREIAQRTWPDLALVNRQFSVAVSHDVDNPRFTDSYSLPDTIRGAARELRHGRLSRRAATAPFHWLLVRAGLRGADPYDRFAWMMQQCEQRGLRSTFHFLCGRTDPRFDRDYRLGEPFLRTLLHAIHQRGHVVGVHPSYGTYRAAGAIHQECEELRRHCADLRIPLQPLVGRMHYLRWATPVTAHALAAAGVARDCTLGFAETVGFRCGTCLDYQAFDPVALTSIALRIQPLLAMDVTVLPGRYLNLPATGALQRLTRLKQICRTLGGCFTLCWHNSELDTASKRRLFLAILDA